MSTPDDNGIKISYLSIPPPLPDCKVRKPLSKNDTTEINFPKTEMATKPETNVFETAKPSPEKPLNYSDKSTDTIEKPADTPEKPADTPEKPMETPEKPMETPEKPMETSEKPMETNVKTTHTPEKPVAVVNPLRKTYAEVVNNNNDEFVCRWCTSTAGVWYDGDLCFACSFDNPPPTSFKEAPPPAAETKQHEALDPSSAP